MEGLRTIVFTSHRNGSGRLLESTSVQSKRGCVVLVIVERDPGRVRISVAFG
jgi:hypothetical protein